MSYNDLLVNSCYIQTAASSQNEWLDWTYTYTTATAAIKCRMTAVSEFERIDDTGRFDDIRYFGYFESDASISEGNRLVYDSKTFVIREVVNDSASHHKEALLSEIKV